MLIKYASSKFEVAGSLDEVLEGVDASSKDRALSKVASMVPVARCLEDYLYVRSWAVSAGEIYGANDNLDYFPGDELKRSYATFINTGFYKDHANSNVKLAYGLNLDAVYTPKDFVAVISAVKKANLQPDQEWFATQIKSGKLDQVSMGCLKSGTPVTLRDGRTVPIEDVKVGDEVINHFGQPDKVVSLFKRQYNEPVHRVSVTGLAKMPVHITKEHPVWVLPKEQIVKKLPELAYGGKGGSDNFPNRTIDATQDYKPGWVNVGDLRVGDYVAFPFPTKVETPLYVNKDFARLAGYYLSEGNLNYNKHVDGSKVACGITLTFSLSEKDTFVAESVELCNKIFGSCTVKEQPDRNCIRVNAWGTDTATLLSQLFGKGAKTKVVAKSVMHWEPSLQLELIGTFLNGDGCVSSNHSVKGVKENNLAYLETASYALAQQFCSMLARNGIIWNLEKKQYPSKVAKFKSGTVAIKESTTYRVAITKRYFSILGAYSSKIPSGSKCGTPRDVKFIYKNWVMAPISAIETIEYNEPVYNFEVQGSHSYLVNGFAVHNCQVEESTCSNCGNKATNVGDYCGCLQHARMSRSAAATGFCQECQAPAGGCLHIREAKKLGIAFDAIAKTSTINGHPLYEINRGCTFFDLSGITTVAADRLARIAEVIDKQASSALFDFIRPSLTVQTEGGSKVDNLTGGTHMANLEKKAADKNPQLKNQVEGGNPTEMTDAGDYDQKAGNPEALQEKAQKAQSAAPKKEHEIRERGQHDAGDYGAESNPKTLHNDESHDAYSKTEQKGVSEYRADAAKGVTGLGKEAQSNDSFVTELKGFFRGLMDKKAETVAAPVVNKGIDLSGLDEVRASLRDDLESLQEATDKLHDEKLKLVAKKATASISMVQKRAQGEIDQIDALDKEIAEAKGMVEGTLTEMRDVLEGASKTAGVGAKDVAGLKAASLEIRAEVDKVLDKAVIIVAAKSIIPVKKADAKVADVKPNVGKVQERQLMTDAGDYNLPKDPYKALDANNKATANTTQTAIEKQNETLTGKPEDWVAYRKLNALTRQYVAAGKTLKEAKVMAKGKLEAIASEAKKAAALKRVADTEGLKAQIVNTLAEKLSKEIFESDPALPENVATAEAAQKEDGNAEAKQMFSSDVKPALTATKKAAKEDGGNETYPGAAAIKGDSEQEPSSPYWDLFPEDNISSVCNEANKEMSSRSKETMKETTASVASTQPLFSNKVAYDRAESQQSLAGSDSLSRILEAISLADKEVNAGLVDEAQMEEEAKRLFISSPDELRATSKVVAKVAKKANFKSPVPEGFLRQAVSMGEGASASSSNEMSLFDNDGEGLY